LQLCRWLDVCKGQPEFLGVTPANRGSFNSNRVNIILWEDPTHELLANWDKHGTRDTTTPGGEVSELSLTGHLLALRGKLTAALDGDTNMLTHNHRSLPRQQGLTLYGIGPSR
jgi:hypothetical protein